MEGFQKIVLIIAIIVLIVTLVFIGMVLVSSNGETWPPLVPDCPDWWIADGSGNNTMCINVKDLGVCPAQSGQKHQVMNFNTSMFTGLPLIVFLDIASFKKLFKGRIPSFCLFIVNLMSGLACLSILYPVEDKSLTRAS